MKGIFFLKEHYGQVAITKDLLHLPNDIDLMDTFEETKIKRKSIYYINNDKRLARLSSMTIEEFSYYDLDGLCIPDKFMFNFSTKVQKEYFRKAYDTTIVKTLDPKECGPGIYVDKQGDKWRYYGKGSITNHSEYRYKPLIKFGNIYQRLYEFGNSYCVELGDKSISSLYSFSCLKSRKGNFVRKVGEFIPKQTNQTIDHITVKIF